MSIKRTGKGFGAVGALVGLLAGCGPQAGPAPVANAGAAGRGDTVCLRSYMINRTQVVDDRTILFYMNDGKIWKNTLLDTCPTLKSDTLGFTYQPTDSGTDEICSNLVTIRTNTSHIFCDLGAFTLVSTKGGLS